MKQLLFLIQREDDDKKISILVDEYKNLIIAWAKFNFSATSYVDAEKEQVELVLQKCFDTEEYIMDILERV